MEKISIPKEIQNWIEAQESPAIAREWFSKVSPVTGQTLCQAARSRSEDVQRAVQAAQKTQPSWAELTVVRRGEILNEIAAHLKNRREEMARVVALETGKSYKSALGETDGAIALGLFFAGEGYRSYGKTTASGIPHRHVMTIRQPCGLAGLIVPANTPIANVAWKVFPALICGNAAILKAAEDAPATAWFFGQITHQAGLPPGILNILHGYGQEAGSSLVEHPDISVISFTGSTSVGKKIGEIAGKRFAKVSLELGGKNPFIVCDDADLDKAVYWALLSIFSNAGQRCAAASRMIVFDSVYDSFKKMLIERTKKLKAGPTDQDDLGPVINLKQLDSMISAIVKAKENGASIIIGGYRMIDSDHQNGFYMAPTLIENASPSDEISNLELFGPIACLYRVKNFSEALVLANHSPYGLTACIHTRSLDRAMQFTQKVQAGVAVVNAGTYGSEPHLPFGGLKQSGNGTREPGTEALDIYSNLKNIYINSDPSQI